jgi:hypothetical protein
MNDLFEEYFTEGVIEYPSLIATDILPWNVKWRYISQAFLNGFINYVEPVKAYVLSRYTSWDQFIGHVEIRDNFRLIDFHGTKLEVYEKIIEPGRMSHTELSCLCDDIVILATPKDLDVNSPSLYYYFWFDMDVSDCCIGRFKTHDSLEVVVDKFTSHCIEQGVQLSKSYIGHEEQPRELPIHFFEGWVSW